MGHIKEVIFMLILAKSIKGQEFIYNPKTAHKVPKKSAEYIRDILNAYNHGLQKGETWYLHNVYSCDNAYYYAETQEFRQYQGRIRERIK